MWLPSSVLCKYNTATKAGIFGATNPEPLLVLPQDKDLLKWSTFSWSYSDFWYISWWEVLDGLLRPCLHCFWSLVLLQQERQASSWSNPVLLMIHQCFEQPWNDTAFSLRQRHLEGEEGSREEKLIYTTSAQEAWKEEDLKQYCTPVSPVSIKTDTFPPLIPQLFTE